MALQAPVVQSVRQRLPAPLAQKVRQYPEVRQVLPALMARSVQPVRCFLWVLQAPGFQPVQQVRDFLSGRLDPDSQDHLAVQHRLLLPPVPGVRWVRPLPAVRQGPDSRDRPCRLFLPVGLSDLSDLHNLLVPQDPEDRGSRRPLWNPDSRDLPWVLLALQGLEDQAGTVDMRAEDGNPSFDSGRNSLSEHNILNRHLCRSCYSYRCRNCYLFRICRNYF